MILTPNLYLRCATPDDIDTIFRWRYETADWLAKQKNSDQWSSPYPRRQVEEWVTQGATVMASLEPTGPAIATVTVTSEPEPGLWTEDEVQVPARYMSKLNVAPVPELRGVGIGEALISWVRTRSARAGVKVIRFDVWSSNTSLHAYYVRRGFRYLRTVPHRNSGALFEGDAFEVPGLNVFENADASRSEGNAGRQCDATRDPGLASRSGG